MKIYLEDLKMLSKNIGANVNLSLIQGDSTFRESGLDALDTHELVTYIEEKYRVSITNHDFNRLKTYQDLLDCSNNAINKKVL